MWGLFGGRKQMIEVKIKIEEMFCNEVVVKTRVKYNKQKDYLGLLQEVKEVIYKKLRIVDYNGKDHDYAFNRGEDRISVIKALWEYQKGMCDIISPFLLDEEETIWVFKGRECVKFYDPTTRTITITKFEEGSNE
jgi:hypothetical protein